MTIALHEDVFRNIRAHGEQDYPYECCGFLIGRIENGIRIVEEIRKQENERDSSRETRYLISPKAFKSAETYARETDRLMLGIYHSHPDHPARPSDYDRDHAWPWYAYLILSVAKGKAGDLNAWELRNDRSAFDPENMNILTTTESGE